MRDKLYALTNLARIYEIISNFLDQIESVLLANRTSAESSCRSLGGNWTVGRVFQGSLECSTVDWDRKCKSCNKWRRYVWENGFTANLIATPCPKSETLAGHYYCGSSPCPKCGHDLIVGKWVKGKPLL